MRRKNKFLISIISAVMICILVSTATTTVANSYYGNLKTGDITTWKYESQQTSTNEDYWISEVEIEDIDDEDMQFKWTRTKYVGGEASTSYTERLYYQDGLYPYIRPAAEIQQLSYMEETTYNYQGARYKALLFEGFAKAWWDYDTGILFEWQEEDGDGNMYTRYLLQDTTATLTSAGGGGGCLGSVLIALVSVSTLVSYSLVRYQKKKRT